MCSWWTRSVRWSPSFSLELELPPGTDWYSHLISNSAQIYLLNPLTQPTPLSRWTAGVSRCWRQMCQVRQHSACQQKNAPSQTTANVSLMYGDLSADKRWNFKPEFSSPRFRTSQTNSSQSEENIYHVYNGGKFNSTTLWFWFSLSLVLCS